MILLKKKILPESPWRHSLMLSAFDACRAWGIRPSAMGLCEPMDDLAHMIATVEAKAKMTAVDDALAAWEMKEKQKGSDHGK